MNVLILDPTDALALDGDLAGRVAAAGALAGPVCRVTRAVDLDGAAAWMLHFSCAPPIRTRAEPDGLACAALLACDQFAADDELVILAGDESEWAGHFARLGAARPHGVDVFLSFGGDGPARLDVDPDLTALLSRTGGVTPGLAWYRTAGLFYTAAKQVIRKDARWAGQYTADSVLRELALHDARVGYHGRPWEMHSPAAG